MRRVFPFLALTGALCAFFTYQVDMDDFFITIRYAVNVAQGRGWVFNPGERVQGTTTPLLTILIALFMRLGLPPIFSVRLICSAFLFGTSIFCYGYFRRKGQEGIGFAAGLILYFILPVMQLFGNEVPLCFFFIMASLYYFDREEWKTSAVFQCLYALTRMEGLLFFIICTTILFWRKKKVVYGVLIPPVLLIIPWFVFSHIYFGDIFPNTLYAKARQGAQMNIWIPFSTGLHHTWRELFLNAEIPFFSLCAWFGLTALLRRRHGLLLSWIIIHQVSYWLIGVPGSYKWYYYPLWLLYPMALAGGVAFFSGDAADFSALKGRPRIVYGALLAFLLFQGYRQPHINTFYHARHDLYKNVAAYIRQNMPAGSQLIADEIGIIGYLLPDYTILDTAGIVHKNIPYEAYFRYEYLVSTFHPSVIINCQYPRKDATVEQLQTPLRISLPQGKVEEYDVMRIFPGKNLTVRVMRRKT